MDSGLIPCPYCDHEVIAGSDECDGCGQPLTDLHLAVPATLVERRMLTDRLSMCAYKPPLCVSPTLVLREALRMMVDNRVGALLVMDQGKVVGIFTERDVLRRVGTQAQEFATRPVSDFMTPGVHTLKGSSKIAFAVQRMDVGGFRHLPIVDDAGHPLGIASVRDLLHYLSGLMRESRLQGDS